MADVAESPIATHPTRTSTTSSTSSSSSGNASPTHSRPYRRPTRKATTPIDPFAALPEPSRNCDDAQEEQPATDSFFTRLVAAPLLFVAFLLSLSWVERRNRSARVAARARPPGAASLWERARDWWDPEPYRDGEVDEWSGRDAEKRDGEKRDGADDGEAEGEPKHAKRKHERWHANTKQRRMASLEAAEAFELVGTMKAVVASVVVLGTVGAGWGVMKVWETFG